jgi:arginase
VSTVFLLYPEWQGSGKNPAVHDGAVTIARALFPHTEFLVVESPVEERLARENGVVGLRSIAPRFREVIERLREAAPSRVVTVGGTCGVEAAPIGYLNERYDGELAVVWLDAHGDLNTPASSSSGHFHGMILRTLLGDGPQEYVRELHRPLRRDQVFLAATRDLDPPEAAFVAQAGIALTPADTFSEPERLVDRIRARGYTRVYVHLDLDALDPAEFPDALIPIAGGPSLAHVRRMLQELTRSFDVAGASIVEYVHRSDESLRILNELLACYCRV